MEKLWQQIHDQVSRIISSGSGKPKQIYGRELIDLPQNELILYGAKLSLGDGTIELTLATPAAFPSFEWIAEITIKEPSNVEHYLLRPDKTIVETYGKNVYDATSQRANSLLEQLNKLP